MQFARRPLGRASLSVFAALALFLSASAQQQKPRLDVTEYVIDADITPRSGRLEARARVSVTALEDLSVATFELHNALRPTKVTDADGKVLSVERVTQDSTIRVVLPAGLAKGQTTTLTFDYEGTLAGAQDSPVEGLSLAKIGGSVSYLLYAGRWFPVVNFGLDRFKASVNVTVPVGYMVVGSGRLGSGAATRVEEVAATAPAASQKGRRGKRPAPAAAPQRREVQVPGKTTFRFAWDHDSFPGTLIAGHFTESTQRSGGLVVNVYVTPVKKEAAQALAQTALQQFEYFTGLYGPIGGDRPSTTLNVVELPDDTVPSAWAPEIAAVASRAIGTKSNFRLLANTIAHQWWGASVGAASRNDWWIVDGTARYSEVRWVEHSAGPAAFEEATKDMSVGALAYDDVPLSSSGRLDPFAPEFQSLATDKGGMIHHMLRWAIGPAEYDRAIRTFATQFASKNATAADFQKVAEQVASERLTAFFTQWLDGTGAPEFKNKYTVFRTQKGFRVVGEISQDLDLFRMPLELRIDTDGQSEMKRIEVVGTASPFSVETFGKPRRIILDPNNWVLKNSPELKVRVAILRGQQLVAQGDLAEALKEFQRALDANKNSSLAHYRIAEVFFLQRNYQSAANAYREAINGDREPRWTEVWSHIQLGKIFDATGQRERAVNEYRRALATNDDTQGALEEARRYLQQPYQREATAAQNTQ